MMNYLFKTGCKCTRCVFIVTIVQSCKNYIVSFIGRQPSPRWAPGTFSGACPVNFQTAGSMAWKKTVSRAGLRNFSIRKRRSVSAVLRRSSIPTTFLTWQSAMCPLAITASMIKGMQSINSVSMTIFLQRHLTR